MQRPAHDAERLRVYRFIRAMGSGWFPEFSYGQGQADDGDEGAVGDRRRDGVLQGPAAGDTRSLGDLADGRDDGGERVVLGDGARHQLHAGDGDERAAQERHGEHHGEADALDGVRAAHDHAQEHAERGEGEQPEQDQPGHLGEGGGVQVRAPAQGQAESRDDQHAEDLLDHLAGDLRGDDGQAGDRQGLEALGDAAGEVGGGRDPGADHAEGDGLGDHAGKQVVLVAQARDVDRAAEYVQEQQGEDDRLEGDVGEAFGYAGGSAQPAADQQRALTQVAVCGGGPGRQRLAGRQLARGRLLAGRRGAHAASFGGCPVRARNASSRVGRRRAISSTLTPASRTRDVTAARSCAERGAGTESVRRLGSPVSVNRVASTVHSWANPAASAVVTSTRCCPIWFFSWAGVPLAVARPWSISTMWSARVSASSRYWVVSSTVMPSATRSRTVDQTTCRLRGSRPVVGSSSTSRRGWMTRLAARSTRRRCPPETDFTSWSRNSPMSKRSMSWSVTRLAARLP